MRKQKYNLGVDIGGTKINMGVVSENGAVLYKKKIATLNMEDRREGIRRISGEIRAFLKENGLDLADIAFIGAGVPGTVDTKTGFVDYCPNLNWIDQPIGDYFLESLDREVKLIQDSRAAAFAEYLYGAGRGFSDIICLTLGTGIGCGIIIGGRIFHGGMNTAGEVGHMPIAKHGRKCVCGAEGCLEQYSSGTALITRALERFPEKFEGREKRSETVFEMAYAGDADALGLIGDFVDDLAFGIANVVDVLSSQAVVISGGLCEHESLVIEPLKKKVPEYGYFGWKKQDRLKILKAELTSDAPMIGAAMLYKSL
jgi:glucokinase